MSFFDFFRRRTAPLIRELRNRRARHFRSLRMEWLENRSLLAGMPSVSLLVDQSVLEGNAAQATVRLSQPSDKVVSVWFSTTDGTATSGADYAGFKDGSIWFAPGEVEHIFAVETLQDSLVEGDETFTLALTRAENAKLAASNSGQVTIIDANSIGSGGGSVSTLDVGAGNSLLYESTCEPEEPPLPTAVGWGLVYSGFEGEMATFSVARGLWGNHALTVSVEFLDGDAYEDPGFGSPAHYGQDYGGPTTFTVTIPACQMYSETFALPLLHDVDVEDPEYFWGRITDVQGGYVPPEAEWLPVYIDDVTIDIDSVGILVVNDDDDDGSGQADYYEAEVVADDELQPVIITLGPTGNLNLTGYEFEVQYSGPITLWWSASKDLEIPSGTRFPVGPDLWLYAEGLGEGEAQVTAQLIDPEDTAAAQKYRQLFATRVWVTRDGAEIGDFAAQIALVGQKVALDVGGTQVAGVTWSGVSRIRDYEYTNTLGKVHYWEDADMTRRPISFYWESGGTKLVDASITIADGFGQYIVHRFVRFGVGRPTYQLAVPQSDQIRMYDVGNKTYVQLGMTEDPNVQKTAGITFAGGPVNAPINNAGDFLWLQLTGTSEWQERTDGIYRKETPELVLDGPPVFHDQRFVTLPNGAVVTTTNDSPFSEFTTPPSLFESFHRNTEYRMYLMWQPKTPDSIPVPLGYVDWATGWGAQWNANQAKWDLLMPVNFTVMGSEDTTVFPEWRYNIQQFGFVKE